VRSADALAVVSPTPAEAVAAQPILSAGRGTQGVRWSDATPQSRHLRDGVNVLGCTIRHYPTPQSSRRGYKLLLNPSQAASQQLKWKLKGRWRTPVRSPPVALIKALKPVIRGWRPDFRIGVAKAVFTAWDRCMDERAPRYRNRRHPRKSGWWRTPK
jgi:RNA-directed DNA polymerase